MNNRIILARLFIVLLKYLNREQNKASAQHQKLITNGAAAAAVKFARSNS
jgi:hypothetical protein